MPSSLLPAAGDVRLGRSMRSLLLTFCLAWSNVAFGAVELKAGSFTLKFDEQGRPSACVRIAGGASLLRPGPGQEGFALVGPDQQATALSSLRLLPDGRLEAATADGRQAVLFAVHAGDRHLALRIVELRGLEPAARDKIGRAHV